MSSSIKDLNHSLYNSCLTFIPESLDEAAHKADQLPDPLRDKLLKQVSCIWADRHCYKRAAQIASPINNDRIRDDAYEYLAETQIQMGQLEDALKSAVNIFNPLRRVRMISKILVLQERFHEAYDWTNFFEDKLSNDHIRSTVVLTLAKMHQMGWARFIFSSISTSVLKDMSIRAMASAYIRQKDFDKAFIIVEKMDNKILREKTLRHIQVPSAK